MLKNKKTVISMVSALCAFAIVGGVSAINANANTALNGFTYEGISVNAEDVGVRFAFNLTGTAAEKKDLTAGVVYMPADLYTGDLANFTVETEGVATATFGWEETETENEYVGYSYLQASAIPVNMYNRVLIVRGYIEDGENVYYTNASKASMAYSAWSALENYPEDYAAYEETLKTYMGPYTIANDVANVENVYYGDTFYAQLPTENGGKNIAKWYWDAAKTVEVAETDYATGSMNVYYEYEKFAVSGTVTGGDETVKIYANGAEVGTVAANGEYSVNLEAGAYELRFANDTKVAYASVEVTEATEVNATLVSNKWEAVNKYGNTTYDAPTYTKGDELDGSFTASGANYDLIFPNTATANAFSYEVSFTVPAGETFRQNMGPGITVACGNWRLTMVGYLWGQCLVSLSAGGGFAYNTVYASGKNFSGTWKMQVVRTADKIDFYAHGKPIITVEKGRVTAHVANQNWGDSLTSNISSANGFFAENAKIAVGVSGLKAHDGAWATCPATFNLSMQEFATVSGKVSLPAGSTLDLTTTTLSIGNVAYDMTIDAEGNFTAYVPEGTQTLEFANGTWGATAADQVITLNATNTVNVELADYTWKPGTFNGVATTSGLNETEMLDGSFVIGSAQVVFPNTATTGAFTYTAQISTSSGRDQSAPMATIIAGNAHISVGMYAWQRTAVVNVADGASIGAAFITYFTISALPDGNHNYTVKFVRLATGAIECYINDGLCFTFTKEACTPASGVTNKGWGNSLDANWGKTASFFAENASICAGLRNAIGVNNNGIKSATYTCTFTNN